MEYSGVCDIGRKRTVNQDSVFMAERGETGLFCVADGMGGHSCGERASGEIVHELEVWWESFREEEYNGEFPRMMFALNQVLERANETIHKMGNGQEICGTTVAVLFIHCGKYGVLSAGDSRIYLCRCLRVKQLTVDEVWENQINLSLSEQEKQLHPNWGKLVNAIGIAEEARVTSTTDMIQAGAVFMLCSDGLYKMLPERSLCRYLKKCRRYTLDAVTDKMLRDVYERGAEDNVSVILVKI